MQLNLPDSSIVQWDMGWGCCALQHLFVCVVRVTQTPQTLLWEQLNTELPTIEAKISPLFDQFAILDKYEVVVTEDISTTLLELPNKFRDFQQTLVDADIMLKKHKVEIAKPNRLQTSVVQNYFYRVELLCISVFRDK